LLVVVLLLFRRERVVDRLEQGATLVIQLDDRLSKNRRTSWGSVAAAGWFMSAPGKFSAPHTSTRLSVQLDRVKIVGDRIPKSLLTKANMLLHAEALRRGFGSLVLVSISRTAHSPHVVGMTAGGIVGRRFRGGCGDGRG
jgi:hypothetical protein